MRKILSLVVMILVSLVIVACGDINLDLDTPTNVAITNGIVTWDAVEDAEEYHVIVGTDSHTVTTTTFDLNTLELAEGSYQVTVVAVSGDSISLPSSTASYVVEANVVDPTPTEPVVTIDVYADVLALMDETYVPDMDESDFTEDWEYRDYQRMSSLATTYNSAVNARAMTETNALGFFSHVVDMADSMTMIESVSDMMENLDAIEDFNMTTEDFAYIVLELGLLAMTLTIDDLTDELPYLMADLDYFEAELVTALASAQYIAIYDDLEAYATTETLPYLDAFFMGDHDDFYYIYDEIGYIVNDLIYYYESHDADYYLMHDEPMITAFYNILLDAKIALDSDLLISLSTQNRLDYAIDVYNIKQNIRYTTKDIESIGENIVRMGELLAYFTLEKTMMRQTVQDVADYVVNVYGSISPALVTLLDNTMVEEATMEEIFLIKDEVLTILHTTLPVSEDFSTMYYTMFHVANALGDFDLVDFYDYTDFLGDLVYTEFDLLLTFAAAVDQTTVEDIMEITDGMYISGEYTYNPIYDYYYYTDDVYDFEKIIQLAVYVGTFLEDFKLANEVKFTTMETLLGDAAVEELLLLFGDLVKQVMALDMDEDELTMAEFVVDEVLADYDHIVAGLGVLHGVGIDVITEFLATEGQMFLDFYQLTQTNMDVIDQTIVAEIESVFAQLVDYNTIIASDLTQPEIEKLLRIIRVPLMIQMMMEDEMFVQEDFNLLFAELLTPVSTVMSNVITLENQMLTIITSMDVATLVFNSSWNLSEEQALMGVIILALDELFTTANETLFFNTLTLIGDDILSNTVIMDMNGITQQDVDDMILELETHFETVFMDLHLIADYDFTTLTPEQILEIETLLKSMFSIYPEEEPIMP